ncbi:ribosome-associated translation inhibitor RaiA [candidate division KSB1 bacterium]|nr:ribosome-associated translation inhibitor RaiA [bacterium]RKY76546.1 MAG: ribosome-associated translation inhibitor RaiA [candidate division KSB1 bacterium]RKY86810.1 MAG: ribosome-associated translation inhibitor RaiA [candidate division KSB1 bacterium]HDI52481.1 ribosome-associated translation inhibitor RaiA [Bacteroidota bacterium]
MRVTFTARHFKASEQLRQYAENEVKKLKKFFDGIVDCDVILTKQRANCTVEITINVHNSVLPVKETSDDFFKSIDLAVEKMERQLKKYKEKLRGHPRKKLSESIPIVKEEKEKIEQI